MELKQICCFESCRLSLMTDLDYLPFSYISWYQKSRVNVSRKDIIRLSSYSRVILTTTHSILPLFSIIQFQFI